MTTAWRLGTAEPIQSSGEDTTVFWRLGTAFISHEYEESGTPGYNGSGSVEINFGASATGGYFIIGEGNVEVDFGVAATGTYACTGSASVEVDISCSGTGEYVEPDVYNGSGSVGLNLSVSSTGTYHSPIYGDGSASVDFGITSTGTYSVHGSGTIEIPFYVSSTALYFNGMYGEGTMLINFLASGTGRYEGLLSEITISPAIANVRPGGTRVFTAIGYDAVGNIVDIESGLWEVDTGGTIDPDTGLFTAGEDLVSGTVTCTSGEVVGEAVVNIVKTRSGIQQGLTLSLKIGF